MAHPVEEKEQPFVPGKIVAGVRILWKRKGKITVRWPWSWSTPDDDYDSNQTFESDVREVSTNGKSLKLEHGYSSKEDGWVALDEIILVDVLPPEKYLYTCSDCSRKPEFYCDRHLKDAVREAVERNDNYVEVRDIRDIKEQIKDLQNRVSFTREEVKEIKDIKEHIRDLRGRLEKIETPKVGGTP